MAWATLLLAAVCAVLLRWSTGEDTPHTGTRIELSTGLARLIINIGCHQDPPEPFDSQHGRIGVLAIEARTDAAARINDRTDRWVLTCAIAPHFGLASFNSFRDSSSLLEPVHKGWHWKAIKNKGQKGKKIVVPTVPLSYILQSLSHYKIWYLKTDTQGMDLAIIKSAGEYIKEVPFLFCEIWCNNYTSYSGTQNDFEAHWLPYMTSMGFVPVEGPQFCRNLGSVEENALWRNTRATITRPTVEECPKCYT